MSSSDMASTGASNNAPLASKSKESLWDHVQVLQKGRSGGGTMVWKCNYCGGQFTSSYTRLKYHLLKKTGGGIGACEGATAEEVALMLKQDEESKKKKLDNAPKKVPLPPSTSSVSLSSMGTSEPSDLKKRKVCGSLANAFNNGARERLDAEIARMFYSAGLPFNLARNPYFKSAFQYAANTSIPGYVPPGYNKLRTTLLQKERVHIDGLLNQTRAMWSDKGVTIVSDGWSDSQRRPLINFIAVVDGQPMFLKAVNCSGDIKDKYFIANLLKDVINEIGYEKVVQVITDNASNCKGAGQDFSDYDSISNRYGMGPKEWWLLYGSSAPLLQNIALKLLAQPSSSSCAERNWSTYSFIHSMRRNQMTPKRAEDLVFIHSNLRLLSRRTPEYTQGETKFWDIEGDAFDTFEDVGGLDMANLSLDEPELESILSQDDGGDGMHE